MKKLIALSAAVAASLFVFAPTQAEAGSYRSKVIGTCGGCGGHIHSYYRPVRSSCGQVRYSWVPSYHNNCGRTSAYRVVRSVPYSSFSRHYYPRTHGFSSRGYSSRGYVSRGTSFSFSFGGSRGHCR